MSKKEKDLEYKLKKAKMQLLIATTSASRKVMKRKVEKLKALLKEC
jgi:hypothetical protein